MLLYINKQECYHKEKVMIKIKATTTKTFVRCSKIPLPAQALTPFVRRKTGKFH